MTRLIMHCFSEDIEFASDLIAFSADIYFSFSGTVTYKNAPKIQEAASKIPLNRILIETDSPFLAPIPVRGTVNEPANVRYVLDKICELRCESREEIESALYANALRVYGIQKSL
jgi:TatD DNase family protein